MCITNIFFPASLNICLLPLKNFFRVKLLISVYKHSVKFYYLSFFPYKKFNPVTISNPKIYRYSLHFVAFTTLGAYDIFQGQPLAIFFQTLFYILYSYVLFSKSPWTWAGGGRLQARKYIAGWHIKETDKSQCC